MNIFNAEEFRVLSNEWNKNAYQKDITLVCTNADFFESIKHRVESDRRGEVVFAVRRKNGKFILTRQDVYPEGIFRIPTGGIGHDENIIKAVKRETMEGLGLKAKITSFEGVLKTKACYDREMVDFYSYVFLLEEESGNLLEDATDDEISKAIEVAPEDIHEYCRRLLEIKPGSYWHDWGRFRYLTTNAVAEIFKPAG